MLLQTLGTYQPAWVDRDGNRICGPDEDVVTLAVEAGRAALSAADPSQVELVVLLTRRPSHVLGSQREVLSRGLGVNPSCPVDELLGGAPALIERLITVSATTLLIAVDPGVPAGAAAALVTPAESASLRFAGRFVRSLPARVQRLGAQDAQVYDDPRLLRQHGWKPAVDELIGDCPEAIVVGPEQGAASRFSRGAAKGLEAPTVGGAVSVLFALHTLAEAGSSVRLVGLENAVGAALDVGPLDAVHVTGVSREPLRAPSSWKPRIDATIPASLAAYERAFEEKVGFFASRCTCGRLEYPRRRRCPDCGAVDETESVVLPRSGTVYSVVTVRVPVPAKAVPYSLAIVDVADTPLRVLAGVTDAQPGTTAIGDRGSFVLRRIATREQIDDYGLAFQPEEQGA